MGNFNVTVVGAGSWGTAIALHIARGHDNVTLVARTVHLAQEMQDSRENFRYLPRIKFPDNLHVTADLSQAVAGADLVIIMVPSVAFKDTLLQIKSYLKQGCQIAWGTKGMLDIDGKPTFLNQVAASILGAKQKIAVIGGPSFAKEVAMSAPTAIVVAGFGQDLIKILHHGPMRCYSSSDVIGVEFCGVLKNVLAVASGISDGLGLGANTRSALITRGLSEMYSLGNILGVNLKTLMGLSGVGDMVLSCTSDLSRNRRLGLGLGRGQSLKQVLEEIGQVVESLSNIKTLLHLASDKNVSLPITEQVYNVVEGKVSPTDALEILLARQPKAEV